MSRCVGFFTKSFQSLRRCARLTSDLFSLAPRLYGKSLGPHRVESERAICCQLSMRSKDWVGAPAACEDPSLSALHQEWPACPGGIRYLSFLCVSPFFILKPTY